MSTKKRLNDAGVDEWTKASLNSIADKMLRDDFPDNVRPDMVDKPTHYQGGIECIEYIKQTLGNFGTVAYCQGNVTKYLHRWKQKGGIEDLKKARWYLDRMIKEAEGSHEG